MKGQKIKEAVQEGIREFVAQERAAAEAQAEADEFSTCSVGGCDCCGENQANGKFCYAPDDEREEYVHSPSVEDEIANLKERLDDLGILYDALEDKIQKIATYFGTHLHAEGKVVVPAQEVLFD